MRTAGIRVSGRRPFDVLTAIEHELNEATDVVIDADEPARWSLTATAGSRSFSSVTAVLDHARRTKSFPRALRVDWQFGTDDANEHGVARLTGVLRRRPLIGLRLELTSANDNLCTRLADALRPRLRRLPPVDHSPAARPRQVAERHEAQLIPAVSITAPEATPMTSSQPAVAHDTPAVGISTSELINTH